MVPVFEKYVSVKHVKIAQPVWSKLFSVCSGLHPIKRTSSLRSTFRSIKAPFSVFKYEEQAL